MEAPDGGTLPHRILRSGTLAGSGSLRTQSDRDCYHGGEQGKAATLFAEHKWAQENMDASMLQTLVNQSSFFHYRHVHFFLFSKTGFTSGCRNTVEEISSVTLITYKEMPELLKIYKSFAASYSRTSAKDFVINCGRVIMLPTTTL